MSEGGKNCFFKKMMKEKFLALQPRAYPKQRREETGLIAVERVFGQKKRSCAFTSAVVIEDVCTGGIFISQRCLYAVCQCLRPRGVCTINVVYCVCVWLTLRAVGHFIGRCMSLEATRIVIVYRIGCSTFTFARLSNKTYPSTLPFHVVPKADALLLPTTPTHTYTHTPRRTQQTRQ